MAKIISNYNERKCGEEAVQFFKAQGERGEYLVMSRQSVEAVTTIVKFVVVSSGSLPWLVVLFLY